MTEIRRLVPEMDVQFLARVYACSDTGFARLEAEILWGENTHGPSATAPIETNSNLPIEVEVSIEEEGRVLRSTARFTSGYFDDVVDELSVRLSDPPGILGLRYSTDLER